ncbi:hypothetical protein F4824DRAFT_466996 [Ustulina deusta]|nr:hypothetical protein F4823DRAFT_415910 [Ustulina deusta]KAI3334720.1 hypothetical protein F4824DRAFT_466996 [Ustulina deusta]
MQFLTIAMSALISIPLDFASNAVWVHESIEIAKQKGATLHTGPELELIGCHVPE